MKEYLDIWPYPPRAKYETGQTISAEVDGVQQRCKVMVVDCDLIQVVFQVSTFFKICPIGILMFFFASLIYLFRFTVVWVSLFLE